MKDFIYPEPSALNPKPQTLNPEPLRRLCRVILSPLSLSLSHAHTHSLSLSLSLVPISMKGALATREHSFTGEGADRPNPYALNPEPLTINPKPLPNSSPDLNPWKPWHKSLALGETLKP